MAYLHSWSTTAKKKKKTVDMGVSYQINFKLSKVLCFPHQSIVNIAVDVGRSIKTFKLSAFCVSGDVQQKMSSGCMESQKGHNLCFLSPGANLINAVKCKSRFSPWWLNISKPFFMHLFLFGKRNKSSYLK